MTMKTGIIYRAGMLTIAAILATSGCSSAVSGNPVPSGTTSSGPGSTAPSSAAGDVFGGMDACQVLNQLLTTQGFDPGERVSMRNECHASKLDVGTYSLALDPVQGLAEFATTDPNAVKTSINGRNVMKSQDQEGMCWFALEVGQHARALAGMTVAREKEAAQACPNARQLAEKLEPLLPKAR